MDQRAAEEFYEGAFPRIRRDMGALTLLFVPFLAILFRWPVAAGFVFGAALSFYNLHSLSTGANALADRITATGTTASGASIVIRFLLRYLVIAGVAYGIFSVSLAAFYGLVGGLFLPIAGVGCEAVYELYVALRRGF